MSMDALTAAVTAGCVHDVHRALAGGAAVSMAALDAARARGDVVIIALLAEHATAGTKRLYSERSSIYD